MHFGLVDLDVCRGFAGTMTDRASEGFAKVEDAVCHLEFLDGLRTNVHPFQSFVVLGSVAFETDPEDAVLRGSFVVHDVVDQV